MADIILLDGRGEPTTYSGVDTVEFDTVTGERVQFRNLNLSDVEINLDFSESEQMIIESPSGEAYTQIFVNKPAELIPENILSGVTVSGVTGTVIPQADMPTIGFLPSAWDADGFAIDGAWFGENIPNNAFSNYNTSYVTWKLQNILFSDLIKSIGNYAFYQCSTLALASLPESITTIGGYAFQGCSALTIPSLPSGITAIGDYTFSGCFGLKLTSLPDGVISIGNYAFNNCSGLKLTSLPDGVTSIGNYAFYGCVGLKLTSLPDGVTSIGNYAFRNCSGLEITSIPASVTTLGTYAFGSCTKLTEITFKGKPNSIAVSAFNGCKNLTKINVPWSEGEVANAPWNATNATINYNYTGV